MDKIIIQGGNNRLVGTVQIEGAKNAVLPLLAATVLASKGKTILTNVPVLSDVYKRQGKLLETNMVIKMQPTITWKCSFLQQSIEW